jgi:inositol transport system permease protein
LNTIKNDTKNISKINMSSLYKRFGIFIILIAMGAVMSILSPNFLTVSNLTDVVRQMSFICLIAFGETIIILTGGIDLSAGSIVGLSSIITALFALPGEYPLVVTILIGLAVGLVSGFINGIIVAKMKIPPFIVTLGMFTTIRGVAYITTHLQPISGLKPEFIFLGAGRILEIPVPIIILIVVLVLIHIMLTRTRFGRHVFAVGGNEQAAIISGINVDRIKIMVYTIGGLMASLSGVILSARIQSGQPGLGVGFELDAIAAAVIGGTSISVGGIGSVVGTFAGALVIGVINNGMNLLNVDMYWQQIVKGLIIIGAVALDQLKTKSK